MAEQQSSLIPRFFNKIMSAVLRSPLHRIASRSVMVITFTGRKTSKRYTTPISYMREGDIVTAFTGARWWRNLAGGAPVTLNIKNKDYQGQADVVADDKEAVADALQTFLRQVHSDARFYNVTYDANGEPNWEEVQRAAQRTVLIRVQLLLDKGSIPEGASKQP